MYELVFRGSLVQYWKALNTELQKVSRKDSSVRELFSCSHIDPPKEFEEVTIEFLDERGRLGLVTVDAFSGADGRLVKLLVHIQNEAYEKKGRFTLDRWNKIKDSWEEKGWLIDPLTNLKLDKEPKSPVRPKQGSSLTLWFDWLHKRRLYGFKCTLKEIAGETGYSYGRIRQLHANYLKSKEFVSENGYDKK